MVADTVLIGIPEIADIAGVTRPAVSNWRKRYSDFPEPRVQSDSGILFDLRAVEDWLLIRGKIDQPIPRGTLVWRVAEALRASWPETLFESTSSMLLEFTISWLCYLEACDRSADSGSLFEQGTHPVDVPAEHRWTTVRESPAASLAKKLAAAAKSIESLNPQLVGLLSYLAPDPFPDPALVHSFVAELEAASRSTTPRFELFEEAQQNTVEVSRTSGEGTTPDSLSYLVTQLVGKIDDGATVVDPACGTGGLLLMAAAADSVPRERARFVGTDINDDATRHTRARFFLYGIHAEIASLDSLRCDPADWPTADVVICDPPYGIGNWGDADLYRSPRWLYGTPPPTSADLAWIQLAVGMLKPTGRAAVVLPPTSTHRGGREQAIREALLRSRVIEAIVHLPPRLRRNTSIPLTIWLLRSPEAASTDDRVLLVDAQGIGTASRSTHALEAEDIESLASLVGTWRSDRKVGQADGISALGVTIDAVIAADADLTPRRYLALSTAVDVDDLRNERDTARAAADQALEEVHDLLKDLKDSDQAPINSSAPASRVLLGEVAELIRPKVGRTADSAMTARAGDILFTATPTGFRTRPLKEGDEISGAQAIVIRAVDDGEVKPDWLLVWTHTNEFADLFERHARGTTIRSLPVKQLAEFELEIPATDVQDRSSNVLGTLARLHAATTALTQQLEKLESAELQLAYARVIG